ARYRVYSLISLMFGLKDVVLTKIRYRRTSSSQQSQSLSGSARLPKSYYGRRRSFGGMRRSEEHTSELQSRFDLVCRLLLEKKNKKRIVIVLTLSIRCLFARYLRIHDEDQCRTYM